MGIRRVRGFTLIEVLAALSVLALTLGGMLGAAAAYGRNAAYLNDKMVAGWIAHNQMVEIQLADDWVKIGKHDAQLEMAGREWFWQREAEKTPDDHIRKVTIRVKADKDEDAWLASVSGFFAQP